MVLQPSAHHAIISSSLTCQGRAYQRVADGTVYRCAGGQRKELGPAGSQGGGRVVFWEWPGRIKGGAEEGMGMVKVEMNEGKMGTVKRNIYEGVEGTIYQRARIG